MPPPPFFILMPTKITMPADLELPADAKPGTEFDAVARLKIEDDGRLTLVSLDGNPVDGGEEAALEVAAEEEGYMEAVTRQMPMR